MLDHIRNKSNSFVTKIIFGLIIVVFVFWGVGNMGGMGSGVIASVNGEKILAADYQKELSNRLDAALKQVPNLMEDKDLFMMFKRQVLDDMIFARLQRQEAERLGIAVTPHELKARIAAMPVFHNESGVFDQERYKSLLAGAKLNPGTFESEIRNELLGFKVIQYAVMGAGLSEAEARKYYEFSLEERIAEYVLFDAQAYADKAEITDNDLAVLYEANKESYRLPVRAALDYLRLDPETLAGSYPVTDEEAEEFYNKNIARYENEETFSARHIFLLCPPEGSIEPDAEAKVAEAQKKAEDLLSRLKEGEDFSDLAKVYSQDRESATTGGLLGPHKRGELGSAVFDDAALALNPGELSGVVRSNRGFHIIKLESKRPAHVTPFADVKEAITAELAKNKVADAFADIQKAAEEGLAEGKPFAELAAQFKVDVLKRPLEPQAQLEKELALHNDARQLFADAVAAAAEGKGVGTPLLMPLFTVDGLVLVTITEARPSEIPPLADVKEPLEASLKTAKGLEMARAAARAALPDFSGTEVPAAYSAQAHKSEPAPRAFPQIKALGPVPALEQALFAPGADDAWLPEVFDVAQGAVVARLAETRAVDDEHWSALKGIFMAQYGERRRNDAAGAFINKLYKQATIERSEEALQNLTFRR